MKLAAIAKLIKADGYCKLYKVFYDDCRTYDLYIGTKTAIFPLTGFPKAQNESELATLLGISKKEWADIEFDNDCPDDLHHILLSHCVQKTSMEFIVQGIKRIHINVLRYGRPLTFNTVLHGFSHPFPDLL